MNDPQLHAKVDSLTARVEQLTAQLAQLAARQPVVTEIMPAEGYKPKILSDTPPFFLSRIGAPDFNKVSMAAGIFVEAGGGVHEEASAEYTISALRWFYARWDHEDKIWDNRVNVAATLPDPSDRYAVIPLGKVTFASGRIDEVFNYHCGALYPPPLALPDGRMDYDVLVWDENDWSGQLADSDFTQKWVPEITRGHAAPPP